MQLYVGSPGNGFGTLPTSQSMTLCSDSPRTLDPAPLSVPTSNAAQPIPLDANGDLKIDLLGLTPGSGTLSLWKNVYNESNPNTAVFETYVMTLSLE